MPTAGLEIVCYSTFCTTSTSQNGKITWNTPSCECMQSAEKAGCASILAWVYKRMNMVFGFPTLRPKQQKHHGWLMKSYGMQAPTSCFCSWTNSLTFPLFVHLSKVLTQNLLYYILLLCLVIYYTASTSHASTAAPVMLCCSAVLCRPPGL